MVIIFGILVGLALGLTGGGGSVFAVPLLVYGLDVAPRDAVVVSLAAVGLTAAFGATDALRVGLVEGRAGIIFASLGTVGAPLGLAIGEQLPETMLILGYAVLALLIAAAMWRKAMRRPQETAVIRANIQRGADEVRAICR